MPDPKPNQQRQPAQTEPRPLPPGYSAGQVAAQTAKREISATPRRVAMQIAPMTTTLIGAFGPTLKGLYRGLAGLPAYPEPVRATAPAATAATSAATAAAPDTRPELDINDPVATANALIAHELVGNPGLTGNQYKMLMGTLPARPKPLKPQDTEFARFSDDNRSLLAMEVAEARKNKDPEEEMKAFDRYLARQGAVLGINPQQAALAEKIREIDEGN